ncbi:hypothetical protein [Prauserella muralis]|uniref:Uncharacterized protein n=1 Tax=Prauserella muralis TaxID=588067 RepID=A0A2V4APH0_9PSEU|nr:hypothetical protein [Prauserella muralis]PXY16561.1 hypothetical protein BAY60_35775 [Prauserella muralis]TWE11201.1 hypothetical protein FHX69_7420 [Prauserella muralis]
MRIVLQRDMCGSGRTCPNINSTDRGTYVVQGYDVPPEQALASGQVTVEVPMSLLPELATAAPRSGLFLTDRETVLLSGDQVTDPDVLAELNMPTGENAVEVPRAMLRELEVTDAR